MISEKKSKNFKEMYAEWKKTNTSGLYNDSNYKCMIPITTKNVESVILEETESHNTYLIKEKKLVQIIDSIENHKLLKENIIGVKNLILTKGTSRQR
jgi:hypothetical protein